jgi:NADPH-dependent 2,4-dienoyl-CoA reductase/sulfur reductase-like enzyme
VPVVIVGASLGGLRVCQALREGGFDDAIVLVGAEKELPYDRPPLSKEILLGTREPDFAALTSPADLDELDVEIELGVAARGLDPAAHRVELADGRALTYDRVVLATGARPRVLPVERNGADLDGVHVLRTMEDGLALRAAFEAGGNVVVVGAGFIGCEVASAAAARGLPVTVVEYLPTPLYAALGPEVGAVVERLHRDRGVDVRCGIGAEAIVGSGRVEEVVLTDGTRLPADVVVVGIGVTPETAWLDGSGLQVDDGVVCDERLRAGGRPDVLAVGDVARWHHPALGRSVRVEHWTNAAESGAFAAEQVLGRDGSYAPVPYVWSDQQGKRIQMVGLPEPGDRAHLVLGSEEDGRLVALYEGDGRLHAAVGISNPGRLMRFRALVEEQAPWDRAMGLVDQLRG